MSNNPIFSYDQNGNVIPILAPLIGQQVSLSTNGVTVLAADNDDHRVVRLLTASTDVFIGVGKTEIYVMQLMAGVAEVIKLAPENILYAKGSGEINVVVLA